MTPDDFRVHAHELVDWMADYLEQVERLPVKPDVQPGTVLKQLPPAPPDDGEPFPAVFRDFREIILPGMTHWQHPSFFAYFPANSSPPSILAEMLTATLGAQCMSWATSPAATELEERVMEWLGTMIGLPSTFTGVIQDTASTATLCALLTARERRSAFRINERGFTPEMRFTVYCSTEAHSSIEKATKIAGLGREYLRKIPVDDGFAMIPSALEEAVTRDLRLGYTPLCVIAAVGTTGSTGLDPLRPIAALCKKHGIWFHVDAAYGGSALLLPEFRWIADGLEAADSMVFNPHKWLLTNFDCSAYFVRDVEALVRTFEILPEYLKTPEGDRVKNYRDWGIQLGRRFRALKLWFVIRTYGVHGLQEILRTQIAMARQLTERIRSTPGFQILAPVPLNVLCFRYAPSGLTDPAALDALNARLLETLNHTGLLYLSHTRLAGRFTLRLVVGQTYVRQRHVDEAWERIVATAHGL
ncbi:MAG TPA: pyridoxal-dependent decarboxylase [Bacteroidota bacterium]|nr:pyridoxal-dependent decarboxylase [Bacteroidota bacterium]